MVVETTCGHAYHGSCWQDYIESKIDLEPDTSIDQGTQLARAYLTAVAGPCCPLCRNENPMLHEMALRFADEKLVRIDRANVSPNLDLTLKMASFKKQRLR